MSLPLPLHSDEPPLAESTAHQPVASKPPQPPLSISHLMLWILGSAVILGGYRMFETEETPQRIRIVHQVYIVAGSFLYGAQVAAVFIFAARLMTRKGPLPHEPGHWLVFKSGASCLIGWGAIGLVRLISPETIANLGLTGLSIFIIASYAPAAALSLWGALVLRGESLWRASFGILFLSAAINVLLAALMLVEQLFEGDSLFSGGSWGTTLFLHWSNLQVWIGDVPMLLCLGLLVLLDSRAGKRRDWVHFAGIAAEGAVMALSLASHLAYAYVLRA
jgi:hypothetical protein